MDGEAEGSVPEVGVDTQSTDECGASRRRFKLGKANCILEIEGPGGGPEKSAGRDDSPSVAPNQHIDLIGAGFLGRDCTKIAPVDVRKER